MGNFIFAIQRGVGQTMNMRTKATQIVISNIVSLMAEKEINPAALARDSGLGATGIYDIMNGRSENPRLDTIEKIADALEVPIWRLFVTRSREELSSEISGIFDRLPAAEQQLLLSTARAWVASRRS